MEFQIKIKLSLVEFIYRGLELNYYQVYCKIHEFVYPSCEINIRGTFQTKIS